MRVSHRFLFRDASRGHYQNLPIQEHAKPSGRFRLDLSTKELQVWDASSVYGRFDASALPEQLAAADTPWQELTLSVA